MIKDWSLHRVKQEVDKIKFAEGDAHMDGFVTWTCKKELYEILWHVEQRLSECSTYATEEEFIREHNTDKMWSILKGDKK